MRVAPTQFGSLPVKNTITKQYNQFLGVDFSTDPAKVDGSRSPNAINLVSDAGGYPEKRAGWEVLKQMPGKQVNGLFHFVTANGQVRLLAHCEKNLYAWLDFPNGEPILLSNGGMADTRSTAFAHEGRLYILDGQSYQMYDGSALVKVDGSNAYTPTTVVGRAPAGGGTPLEAVNLLSPRRKNSFAGFGGAKEVVQLQIYNGVPASPSGTTLRVRLGSDATHTVDMNITVAANDSPTTVAKKIAETTYTGWAAAQIGDSVTFTKNVVGANSTANFFPDSTGVLAGIVTLTPGTNAAETLQLDATNLDIGATVTIAVDGGAPSVVAMSEQNRIDGVVPYTGVMPDGHGVDNIVVEFSKTVYEKDTNGNDTTTPRANPIKKCTIAAWFGLGNDSRVFVSGNPDHQNWDWQSGLYDPTYFPDTGYTKVGADSSAIMGYLKQFSTLLLVKEDNEQDATIYQRTAEIDDNGTAYFPLKQGVAGIGAISKYAFGTLRDDPMFLAKEGVFATSTAYGGVDQQKITQGRSYLVNAKLIKEFGLQEAVATVWKGLYIVCVNDRCYVADGRKKTGKRENEGFGYEWFYWTNIPARCFLVIGDLLYFGDPSGRICRFKSYTKDNLAFSDASDYPIQYASDGKRIESGQPITAIWSSKLDDDGDFMVYKTLPRKGTGIMVKPYARSSIDVYVRTDVLTAFPARETEMSVFDWADIEFGHFSFDTNDAPYIIAVNTKVKRYKCIQIIMRNDEVNQGFGCFGIIRRFNVGNYVK